MTSSSDAAPLSPLVAIDGASRPPPDRRWVITVGVVYLGAWVAGLAVHTGPSPDARPADVLAHYRGAGGTGVIGSVLVHGVAAAAFLVVAHALARLARRHELHRVARTATAAAITATAASAAQVAVAVRLATASSADAAGAWFGILNRLDGVKLIAMAIVVAAGVVAARRRALSTRLGIVSAALGATLLVAGAAFASGLDTITVAAVPALLLLFVWVPATAVAASRR